MPVRPEDLLRQRRWLPIAMTLTLLLAIAAAVGAGTIKRRAAERGLGEPVRIGRVTVRVPAGWRDSSDWRSFLSPQIRLREPGTTRARELTLTVLSGEDDSADGSTIAFGERGRGIVLEGTDASGTEKILAVGSVIDGESLSIELSDPGRLDANDYELVLKVAASVRPVSQK